MPIVSNKSVLLPHSECPPGTTSRTPFSHQLTGVKQTNGFIVLQSLLGKEMESAIDQFRHGPC